MIKAHKWLATYSLRLITTDPADYSGYVSTVNSRKVITDDYIFKKGTLLVVNMVSSRRTSAVARGIWPIKWTEEAPIGVWDVRIDFEYDRNKFKVDAPSEHMGYRKCYTYKTKEFMFDVTNIYPTGGRLI